MQFLRRYFSRRQDIEDVVQEAYLRAYVAEQKKEIAHPKGFLFRIAKNVALTELSSKSRQVTDYLEEAGVPLESSAGASVTEEIEAQEALGIYCKAVSTLPDKCREVFLLRKVYGLRHKEIAKIMSLSLSSVAKYLHQGGVVCEAYRHESDSRRAFGSMQGRK